MQPRSRLLPRGLLVGLTLALLLAAPLVVAILLDFFGQDDPARVAEGPASAVSAHAQP